jgi:hypothetical protein
VEWIALGLASAALGMSTMNAIQIGELWEANKANVRMTNAIAHQVDDLHQSMAETSSRVNLVTHLVTRIGEVVKGLASRESETAMYNSIYNKLSRRVNEVTDIFTNLAANKVPAGILRSDSWDTVLRALKDKAEGAGYQVLLAQNRDLLHAPVSYIVDQGIVKIVVHVPVTKIGEIFRVMEYVPIPFNVHGHSHLQVCINNNEMFVKCNLNVKDCELPFYTYIFLTFSGHCREKYPDSQ